MWGQKPVSVWGEGWEGLRWEGRESWKASYNYQSGGTGPSVYSPRVLGHTSQLWGSPPPLPTPWIAWKMPFLQPQLLWFLGRSLRVLPQVPMGPCFNLNPSPYPTFVVVQSLRSVRLFVTPWTGLQHAGLLCPSPSPGLCSNSSPTYVAQSIGPWMSLWPMSGPFVNLFGMFQIRAEFIFFLQLRQQQRWFFIHMLHSAIAETRISPDDHRSRAKARRGPFWYEQGGSLKGGPGHQNGLRCSRSIETSSRQ